MAYLHPREWIDSLPEDFDDATSFRHMRRFAQNEIDRNMRIRATIVEKHDEQTAVKEWDSEFEADNERCREAIRLIDERMASLGIPNG